MLKVKWDTREIEVSTNKDLGEGGAAIIRKLYKAGFTVKWVSGLQSIDSLNSTVYLEGEEITKEINYKKAA